MRSPSSHFKAPRWVSPLAPPPASAKPMRGRDFGWSGEPASGAPLNEIDSKSSSMVVVSVLVFTSDLSPLTAGDDPASLVENHCTKCYFRNGLKNYNICWLLHGVAAQLLASGR